VREEKQLGGEKGCERRPLIRELSGLLEGYKLHRKRELGQLVGTREEKKKVEKEVPGENRMWELSPRKLGLQGVFS